MLALRGNRRTCVRRAHPTRNVNRVVQRRNYETVRPFVAVKLAERGEGVFIDLRKPGLLDLEGFKRVPFKEFISTPVTSWPRDQDIFLIDETGYTSQRAARILEQQGFDPARIFVVEGGLLKYLWAGGKANFEDPEIDYRFKFLRNAQETPIISPRYMISLLDELTMKDGVVLRRNFFPLKHYSKLASRTAMWWAGPVRYFQLENVPVEQYRVPVLRDPEYRIPDPPKYWGWMPEWGVAYENIPKSPSTVTRAEITKILQEHREAGLYDIPQPVAGKIVSKKSPHAH